MCIPMENRRVTITIVVYVEDIFVVDQDRCEEFDLETNKMVPVKNLGALRLCSGLYYDRRCKEDSRDFTTDLPGRVGEGVWCKVEEEYPHRFECEASTT